MSGSDLVTLNIGPARIEVSARDIVQSILAPLITPIVELKSADRHTPPAIGAMWQEQGGIYAGLMRGENGNPDYHLIAPAGPAAYASEIAWGAQGKEESGAESDFDGLANTQALALSKHKHPVAEWAAGLEIDGHDDFYLPSRRELRLCWVNVPELFEEGYYWSSTQSSAHLAWYQGFGNGYQYAYGKDGKLRARAVRRLLVIR